MLWKGIIVYIIPLILDQKGHMCRFKVQVIEEKIVFYSWSENFIKTFNIENLEVEKKAFADKCKKCITGRKDFLWCLYIRIYKIYLVVRFYMDSICPQPTKIILFYHAVRYTVLKCIALHCIAYYQTNDP